ncbi:hypothetical protein [Piscinibacter sp. XHJ-5]|uniref:hypothetical protein n=1 Tax=Piscinibacter sp. XHJ-5 TaxID=3037797 RepID=UPI0024535767|nr:hypothetical protein [Piscinibacter sp. XHJ-5]
MKPLAVAASLAAACMGAQAQQQPWYVGAAQAFTHDSNVFRRPGAEQSDTISSTSLFGGLNLTPGRQRVYLNGRISDNRYSELKQLNNTSHSLTTGLEWQTIEHLSGSLRYNSRQALNDYTVVGSPEVKNVEKAQAASASVRWGVTSALGIEGNVEKRKIDYSVSDERDTTQDVASLGVRWGGGGQLALGVTARASKSETPLYRPLLPESIFGQVLLGPLEPDEGDRRDLDFTATWTPSGLSTISGRISLTKDDHTAPSRSDFSGVTGAVTWDYQPTGKTKIRASLVRDTGNEASFLSLTQIGLSGLRTDNNRLNWVALLGADWEATAKILVNGTVRYIRGTLDTVTGTSFNSNTSRLDLGARYLATRTITLGCNVAYEQGSSGSFRGNTAGCYGQIVIP